MLLSVLQFAATDGSSFDLTQFGAFGVTLAFGVWVLKDVMRERDKARSLADEQSKRIAKIEDVLTSIQSTFETFADTIDDLTESFKRIPPEVELTRFRHVMQKVEKLLGVPESKD